MRYFRCSEKQLNPQQKTNLSRTWTIYLPARTNCSCNNGLSAFGQLIMRYIQYNARSLDSCKAFITSIPSVLKNRPRMLVEHCVKRMPPQVLVIPGENIRERSSGNFQVKSVDSGSVYDINLETPCPSCTCYDWQKYHLPCKHMLAVFHNYPSWDWDFLPAE